jgi:hypothetical protein
VNLVVGTADLELGDVNVSVHALRSRANGDPRFRLEGVGVERPASRVTQKNAY